MGKITNFFNKYGLMITVVLTLMIFLNTCGSKSVNERNGRRIDKVEKSISTLDSTLNTKVSNEKLDLLLQINALEISRDVTYNQNAIIRNLTRPDDYVNECNKKIKELQEKLKNAK